MWGMVCKKVWYGLDEEEHKLKASLVSIVLATVKTHRLPKVKVHQLHNHLQLFKMAS